MTVLIPDNEFSLHCTNSVGGHPLSANGVFPVRFSLGDTPRDDQLQVLDTPSRENPASLLHVQNLTIRYGSKTVVEPMSFTLCQGQTLALVGESGSGKTTTALALCGLLPRNAHVQGAAYFQGTDLLSLRPTQLRAYQGRDIGVIFQEPLSSLNPVLRIHTQIDEVLKTHTPLGKKQRTTRILQCLEQVELPQPETLMHRYPHQLSGGQRQRVMIAMAIACGPRLLVADEPTTALDVITQKGILDLLHKIQQESNMAVLLISHDLAVVAERSDHVLIMHEGKIVEQGHTTQVLQHPQAAYTHQLIKATLPIELNLHYQQSDSGAHPEKTADLGTSKHYTPNAATTARPLLQVRELHKTFSQKGQVRRAVDGVSFDLHAGETLGLVGASGCGKSTLSRLIMRLHEPDAGDIHFQGQSLSTVKGADLQSLRPRIQMVFQDPYGSLNPRTSIGKLFDQLQRLHFPARSRAERLKQSHAMLDAVHMSTQSLKRYPHEFSGGQRQRIAIARALLLQPELLICDEPVSALDVSIQEHILDLFVGLKKEFNLSYLFISHDLAVVRY
ncbi:MAG TPA: ABC transporter ATP-binding protein, partial [Paenalcaligenes sp.]|nr:ABC transporter ATP-binding protein [Paenalcaligenes sp.]